MAFISTKVCDDELGLVSCIASFTHRSSVIQNETQRTLVGNNLCHFSVTLSHNDYLVTLDVVRLIAPENFEVFVISNSLSCSFNGEHVEHKYDISKHHFVCWFKSKSYLTMGFVKLNSTVQ
ncbi:CLUMA_CG001983, isoform A [Clunio marinus]|uniref:CLUMA_CG001983, isoform A n=1 Tax=Clunio marinus TaxID=568069 RepID=A0A1J1HKZ0_9DIPT|nr:CLUMA_CG001983, isoform A [Clunio marinus]